jgi:heptosyltransferase-2
VLLSGTSDEQSIIDYILEMKGNAPIYSLVGELAFYDYLALLDEAKLLLSNDTGPLHLGAALRVPTLGLFGPDTPERYAPYGDKNFFLYFPPPCSPCNHNYKGIRPYCNNAIYRQCMLNISVDMVESNIFEILQKNG